MTPSTCGECGSPLIVAGEFAGCVKPGCSLYRRIATDADWVRVVEEDAAEEYRLQGLDERLGEGRRMTLRERREEMGGENGGDGRDD